MNRNLLITTILIFLFISDNFCKAQSQLIDPETNCKFILPWNCETCTFGWTGDCMNQLPQGNGILTVINQAEEIMWYDGEMKNGKFDGLGKYRDAMNQLEGKFKNGIYLGTNPYIENKKARIDTTKFNQTEDWQIETTVTKQINNLYFTFPSEGYAYENRDVLVEKSLLAIKENCQLINDTSFTEFTRIRFVTSKEKMLLHAGYYVNALANIDTRSIHMKVTNENNSQENNIINPPIKHEMMHIVSITAWGTPGAGNNWLNEGLATYSENNCSGYSVSEMYRYFLEEKMLSSLESLAYQFYQTEEMISYHQSAYVVEYLISNYGLPKFEALWKDGFSNMENIYGFTSSQLEANINKYVLEIHPKSPKIDWETLRKGCK